MIEKKEIAKEGEIGAAGEDAEDAEGSLFARIIEK
jgi:hypothetical protein